MERTVMDGGEEILEVAIQRMEGLRTNLIRVARDWPQFEELAGIIHQILNELHLEMER
jgi:hypothetical protein